MTALVKCCLNGRRSPAEHPSLPISAGQLAAAGAEAVAAGARALHFHPRDGEARETLQPAWCDAAVRALRATCPGTPLGLSTGEWIEPDPERRLALIAAWRERPDFCSVNLAEAAAPRVMDALWAAGIGVEAGLGSPADAERLLELGVADRCVRILVEPRQPDAAQAEAAALAVDELLTAAAVRVPVLHHGFGPATWAVIEQGLRLGRDVRAGLEDSLVLADGMRARDNAELVAAAVRMRDAG